MVVKFRITPNKESCEKPHRFPRLNVVGAGNTITIITSKWLICCILPALSRTERFRCMEYEMGMGE